MRRLNQVSVLESFADAPDVNKRTVEKLQNLGQLREQLKSLPFFNSWKEYSAGWIAFPIDDEKFVLFLYQFDDDTGALYRTLQSVEFYRDYSDIWDAVKTLASSASSLAHPYVWPEDRPLTPEEFARKDDYVAFEDKYLLPFFNKAKEDALTVYDAYVSSPTSLTVEDIVKDIRSTGGEVEYQGMRGIPVAIIWDHSASKLRAVSNDGVNGYAFVAFPNSARSMDAVYLVPSHLVAWNGKNYRVSNSVPLARYRIR